MTFARAFCRAASAVALATGCGFGAPVIAQPLLNALTAIQPGEWEVSMAGAAPRRLCISSTDALFQIRHVDHACSRMVIADGRTSATVHYSCRETGGGRTTLRVSTPQSVHITTQGIADNAPFDFEAVARRTGACVSRSASR
jgi:hypothetical protein